VGESRYRRYDPLISLKIKEILDRELVGDSRSSSGTDGFIRHRTPEDDLDMFKALLALIGQDRQVWEFSW
jgi:hypothetical protein